MDLQVKAIFSNALVVNSASLTDTTPYVEFSEPVADPDADTQIKGRVLSRDLANRVGIQEGETVDLLLRTSAEAFVPSDVDHTISQMAWEASMQGKKETRVFVLAAKKPEGPAWVFADDVMSPSCD